VHNNLELTKTLAETHPAVSQHGLISGKKWLFALFVQIIILSSVGIITLIPRVWLANQLELVTDEIVYIQAGMVYIPLLEQITTSISTSAWSLNYEHPPLVKLLIGLSIEINMQVGHPLTTLQAARIPSIVASIILTTALYWLGRGPFGQLAAWMAVASLAVSPWLAYFGSLAYLDTTMLMWITLAYLLTWHAIHRPWLYPALAICVALGFDSKYMAILIVPAILLFTVYYFYLIRPYLPAPQRPPIPWRWWLLSTALLPLSFLAADPVLWSQPISHLFRSLQFQWNHSINGHLSFLAGDASFHSPHWAAFYIIGNKISIFITFPAILFCIVAPIQLICFHLRPQISKTEECVRSAFLLIWIGTTSAVLSLLTIVVGSHYILPLAPPTVMAGAYILTQLVRYGINRGFRLYTQTPGAKQNSVTNHSTNIRVPRNIQAIGIVVIVGTLVIGPHLLGLITTPEAEGYTSELSHGENQTLQIHYGGYEQALQWLAKNTQGPQRIGLVALPQTLTGQDPNVTWFVYSRNIPQRFQLQEVHPHDKIYPYDYLVWPMHLIQRDYQLPPGWHVIHSITGGATTYNYIVAPR
jgi:hypothetical protein